jgi:hypothetical protein
MGRDVDFIDGPLHAFFIISMNFGGEPEQLRTGRTRNARPLARHGFWLASLSCALPDGAPEVIGRQPLTALKAPS